MTVRARSLFERHVDDPDPVVSALARAHVVAVEADEREVAERLEGDLRCLLDPAYGMYAMLRQATRWIDEARYYSTFSNIKMSPTASSGLGEHGDEFLANLASKLTQAAVEYADEKWPKR